MEMLFTGNGYYFKCSWLIFINQRESRRLWWTLCFRFKISYEKNRLELLAGCHSNSIFFRSSWVGIEEMFHIMCFSRTVPLETVDFLSCKEQIKGKCIFKKLHKSQSWCAMTMNLGNCVFRSPHFPGFFAQEQRWIRYMKFFPQRLLTGISSYWIYFRADFRKRDENHLQPLSTINTVLRGFYLKI